MFCDECGKEIPGDSEFCGFCGKTLPPPPSDVSQAAPPTPPAPAPPPQPRGVTPPATPAGQPAVPPAQPGPRAGPPGKSRLPWILGGVGLAVVIAVVLVLVFVVFGGGADTSGPEKVVETVFEAMEKQDVDMLFSTMEPSYRSELEDAMGEEFKKNFEEGLFMAIPENMEVTITRMDTEIDGDKATVKVVDGTMTWTGEDGEKVTEKASESDMETTELVKVDGKWYLSNDMWMAMGLDPDKLKDLTIKDEDEKTTTEDSDTTSTVEYPRAYVYPGSTYDETRTTTKELEGIGTYEVFFFHSSESVDKVITYYRDGLQGMPNLSEEVASDSAYFFFGLGKGEAIHVYVSEGRTWIEVMTPTENTFPD